MKKIIFYVGIIGLLLFALAGCNGEYEIESSDQPSLELINSCVSIINDKEKTGSIILTTGEKKGQELIPEALYYQFVIKNTGNKEIGNKGLQIKVEPYDQLRAISKGIIGIDIFNYSSYYNTGLGYSSSSIALLKPGEERKYSLVYELGVSEANSEVPMMAPPDEKLKELKDNALNAYLVVMQEGTEIARFDLKKK